jgi:ubiquinone/menaquinone biosynthesis C-methylase UbiE
VLHPFLARPHALLANRLHDSEGPVLDLCTGTGLVAARIARDRPDVRVIGVDWDGAMIRHARRRWAALGNCAFVLADAARLPMDDASAATVVCCLGLHEMPVENVPKALAEMRRVLSPGGRLLVLDFYRSPAGPLSRRILAVLTKHEPHLSGFLALDLPAELDRAGLRVWRAEHPGRGLYQLVECVR